MGPGDLSKALAPLARATDPRLLVGHETFDDAGIFVLSDDLALVQTVDFFAPIVDDPFQFGQIAAANALSDVYAMGGEPLTALCIVGFPVGKIPIEVLSEILRGGQDKVHEAGASIVGGHSVTDEEVKFGLSVTGRVDPRAMFTNAAAIPGMRLVLTKPIGTGILTTAAKSGALTIEQLQPVIDAMRTLNAVASRAATAVGVRCATDVTGFGLLGHASHIARASNVTIRIDLSRVPRFAGTRQALEAGMRTGGAERNSEYLEPLVDWGGTPDLDRSLLVDPQTSGGLLVAVPPDRLDDYLSRVPGAVTIGEVLPRGATAIQVAE
ncbi:MAG: selenide, water dikinase SelD [Gemmatimonadaceae bacterium]